MTLYSADTPLEDDSDPYLKSQNAEEPTADSSPDWLGMARDAYESSTDYFDSSIRRQQEKNLAHFQNRHAPGSKYLSESYKYRSKAFRPKTRAIVRQNEAAAAQALFSTQDIVHVAPEEESDEQQQLSAQILQELLQYRLDNSIPWYQTALGAFQDALTTGVCISHQYWSYEEIREPVQATDDFGNPLMQTDELGQIVTDEGGSPQPELVWQNEVTLDRPDIELRPIENVRFAPSSDWRDPIGSSPYLIDRFPMHIGDIKRRMQNDDGPAEWFELDDGMIMTAMDDDDSSVRSARENKREDSKESHHAITDFDTAWVHRNIVRVHGDDWLYYTLGVHYLLSEPVPLHTVYRHLARGERPYVLGKAIMETHKVYPAGLVELMSPLQQTANEISNQRIDNVALALNRRWIARRGATIDYRSLTRNVPGSVTLTDDINNDIRVEAPPDVTGSSYQEQDRINMDYDELAGSFSQSSVGSNRHLNETVGGMQMLKDGANKVVEYQIRTFAETWVEPVLKQLIKLEQAFETDDAVLQMVGQKVQAFQKFGIDRVTDKMLAGSMTVRVNVGFQSTDPKQRVDRLAMGLNVIGQFMPQLIQGMDGKEVATEVLGALGYRSVERFFPQIAEGQQDPQLQQMQQEIQQLQQQLQSRQLEVEGRIQQEQIKSQTTLQKAQLESQTRLQMEQLARDVDMRVEQLRNEGKVFEAQLRKAQALELEALRNRLGVADKQLQAEKNEIERGKLQNQRDSLLFQMRLKADEIQSEAREYERNLLTGNEEGRMSQTIMNDRYGNVPGSVG